MQDTWGPWGPWVTSCSSCWSCSRGLRSGRRRDVQRRYRHHGALVQSRASSLPEGSRAACPVLVGYRAMLPTWVSASVPEMGVRVSLWWLGAPAKTCFANSVQHLSSRAVPLPSRPTPSFRSRPDHLTSARPQKKFARSATLHLR